MAVDSDSVTSPLKLALKDFLECFPPPQTGRIIDGYEAGEGDAFTLPTGSILNFHRQVSPNVPLSFQDTWGGRGADNHIKVTLPIEFQGKFTPLPFDPVSGDTSSDHVYHNVEELVRAFPVYVQVNASYQPPGGEDENLPFGSLTCGDRLKLIRLVYKYGEKLLEARQLRETRLILLPMTCVGNFTALPDNNDYLLSDLMSMLPRRRRLHISDVTRNVHKIPGLPPGYHGDLLLEEPEAFVEASPMEDTGLIIGLPNNLAITVSPEDESYDRGQLLNSFATNNRNLFPVVARLTDWDEETSILENHYVRPGIELVIHGWTRQSKVLATTPSGRQYAIPLTYQGQFRILPHVYNGVAELEHAHPGYKLRLVSKPDNDTINVTTNDVLRIRRSDSLRRTHDNPYVKAEKLDNSGRVREVVKLPMSSEARFEEVLEDHRTMNFWIRDLVSFVTDQQLNVELVAPSMDQKISERDLPTGSMVTLCDFIIEPAIYVSVETAEAPAFHIPLRTLVYVTFVQQLEKSSSPLLTKKSPRLSTLDRCVEVLPPEVFAILQPRSGHGGELTSSALNAMTERLAAPQPQAWSVTGGVDDTYRLGGPVMPPVGMRPQSFSTSKPEPRLDGKIAEADKSRSFTARLRDKFKRHKSTENINRASTGDFGRLSLYNDSHHQSQEFLHNGRQNGYARNGYHGDNVSVKSMPLQKHRDLHAQANKNFTIPNQHSLHQQQQQQQQQQQPPSHLVQPQQIVAPQPAMVTASQQQHVTQQLHSLQQLHASQPVHSSQPIHSSQQIYSSQQIHGSQQLYGSQQINGSQQLNGSQQGLMLQSSPPVSPQQASLTSPPPISPPQQVVQPQQVAAPVNQTNGPPMAAVQPQVYGQQGTGYMLMPISQTPQVPPGFMLVPIMQQPNMQQQQQQQPQQQQQQGGLQQPVMLGGNNIKGAPSSSSDEDAESIAYSEISTKKSSQFKVNIPSDGNLYSFSTKKMAEFLRQLRVDDDTVRRCIKDKVDGRKFSKMNQADLEKYNLLQPLVIHFRRSTYKKRPNFML